ncbi:tripartite tricarboxylate transporter substrate binding protein [Tepidibacillus infernus]|uniref:tripartite tricarboxylate transporter substrate binding protein n=1 Tax=Tepidibacillus TaxID=1494427 RepID=UPI001C67C507|nr:tripartite tricarboxylate transporter substrate binding protein [Tepidibacillus sp. HK-1]
MRRFSFILIVILALLVVFTGCSNTTTTTKDAGQKEEVKYPTKAMEFIAPAGAGGGWDLTIRTVAKTLEDTKLTSVAMPVTNKPGGGGGVALAYLQEKKGSDNIISVYSPPLLLINLNGSTEFSYKDTTPIAKLITDYGAFAVSKDSPYNSLNDVMEALKKDPKSVKIGGNSSAGSMDHIQFLIIAKAAGVENIKDIDYISFQDNSGAAQVMGGHLDLLTTGLGEVRALAEAGELKVLATTADRRVGTGVIAEIPTAKEQGIDATFENWRGLFGPPGMPEYAVKYWQDILAKMVETPEWKKAAENNGWDLAFANSEDFIKFLDKTNEDYKVILQEIGMLK